MGGGDAPAGELVQGHQVGGVGNRGGEPAAAVAEGDEDFEVGPVLGEEVDAGDTQVGHPVGDQLGDVLGANEEQVDVGVVDLDRQGALGDLEGEAGGGEELLGGVLEAALVGDGEPDGGHESSLRRSRMRR